MANKNWEVDTVTLKRYKIAKKCMQYFNDEAQFIPINKSETIFCKSLKMVIELYLVIFKTQFWQ